MTLSSSAHQRRGACSGCSSGVPTAELHGGAAVRYFAWEAGPSLLLREGDFTAIPAYDRRGRIWGGDKEAAYDRGCRVWLADHLWTVRCAAYRRVKPGGRGAVPPGAGETDRRVGKVSEARFCISSDENMAGVRGSWSGRG